MTNDLDTLLTALYVEIDDHVIGSARRRPGGPKRLSDAELVCLAVAQVLLGARSEHHWLRLCYARLGHLFPYLPNQPGYHKRLKAAGALRPGLTLIGDKGFAGRGFERLVTAGFGLHLVRPDRRDETPRHGSIGWIRQWIESVNDTLKGQLGLEHHGSRTTEGVCTRITQRLLAMAANRHNW